MMPSIAVVEDNADNRLLLQALLGDRYALTEYENGADALAGIGRSRPDLVLVDISLPGMDGTEILQRLGRTHPWEPCGHCPHGHAWPGTGEVSAGGRPYCTSHRDENRFSGLDRCCDLIPTG